jgi:spermidine/putrescine transport system substrate-binding protein
MTEQGYKPFFIRILMLLFWLSLLCMFLFLPLLFRWFLPERSLTIFTWPTTLDPQYLQQFEQETGIKLYISYYESNQELFSKLRITKGEGYDLIMPSDYTIELLIKEGLLQKIDTTKLSFFPRLDPNIIHRYYDPNNEYSLPFFWGIYGLGINTDYFQKGMPPATWGLLFDRSLIPGAVGMTGEPREAIMIAAQYLFGSIDELKDPQKIAQIRSLLFKQKQWVYAYTEARTEDLLVSKSCPVVVALSTDIAKLVRRYDNIAFLLPQEGTFAFIDALVIPKTTQKLEMIYEFINFLYRPEVIEHHVKKYGFCSPVTDVPSDIPALCPTQEQFKKIDFFRNVVPETLLNEIWIDLMGW